MNAFLALEGGRPMIADHLIALLRSEVAIEPGVRERIAEALAKGKDEPGIRLEVRGTGSGDRENKSFQIQIRRRWLHAGKHIEGLISDGLSVDDAKRNVSSLSDSDGAFGYAASQASEAWKYFKQFKEWCAHYRKSGYARQIINTDDDLEMLYIIHSIYKNRER